MKILEISKKDLLKILNENNSELKEMGQIPKDPGALPTGLYTSTGKRVISKKNKRGYGGEVLVPGEPAVGVQYHVKKGEPDVPASIPRWFVSDLDIIEKLGYDPSHKKDHPVRYFLQSPTGDLNDSWLIFNIGGLDPKNYKEDNFNDNVEGFKTKYRLELESVAKIFPEVKSEHWVFRPNKLAIVWQQGLGSGWNPENNQFYIKSSEQRNDPAAERSKIMRKSKNEDHQKKENDEFNLRELNKILRKKLVIGSIWLDGDDKEAKDFNNKLSDLGLPQIFFNKESQSGIRRVSNEEIVYKLFNIMYFDSYEEFSNYLIDRVDALEGRKDKNELTTKQTLQMPRQEVSKQDITWGVERGMADVQDRGFTAGYGTRKRGYLDKAYNVAVRNVWMLVGKYEANQYKWTISMTITVYKKDENDAFLKNKDGNVIRINPNEENDPNISQEIKIEQTVQNVNLEGDKPIYSNNPHILTGLIDTLNTFKGRVLAIKPEQILNMANFEETEQVNFDELLEHMIQRTAKKLRNRR